MPIFFSALAADNGTVTLFLENVTLVSNDTSHGNSSSDVELPSPFADLHSMAWRLGLIFITVGLFLLCLFISIISFKFSRKKMPPPGRRRSNIARIPSDRIPFAYDNPQEVAAENGSATAATDRRKDHLTVPTQHGHVRQRSLDDGMSHDLHDSFEHLAPGLEQARLAFKDEGGNYVGYSSTKDNINMKL